LPPAALYALAAPSTPETVRQEAFTRAEAGEGKPPARYTAFSNLPFPGVRVGFQAVAVTAAEAESKSAGMPYS
jgi:hypothetical protein